MGLLTKEDHACLGTVTLTGFQMLKDKAERTSNNANLHFSEDHHHYFYQLENEKRIYHPPALSKGDSASVFHSLPVQLCQRLDSELSHSTNKTYK